MTYKDKIAKLTITVEEMGKIDHHGRGNTIILSPTEKISWFAVLSQISIFRLW